MGLGLSLILIAAGAILTWAIDASALGGDINAVGVILIVLGAVGLLLSMMFWSSWGGYGRRVTLQPAARTRRSSHGPARK